jgi:hypothetical protein
LARLAERLQEHAEREEHFWAFNFLSWEARIFTKEEVDRQLAEYARLTDRQLAEYARLTAVASARIKRQTTAATSGEAHKSVGTILEEVYWALSELARIIGMQALPFNVGAARQVRAMDELLIGLLEKSWDSLSIWDGAGETMARAYGGLRRLQSCLLKREDQLVAHFSASLAAARAYAEIGERAEAEIAEDCSWLINLARLLQRLQGHAARENHSLVFDFLSGEARIEHHSASAVESLSGGMQRKGSETRNLTERGSQPFASPPVPMAQAMETEEVMAMTGDKTMLEQPFEISPMLGLHFDRQAGTQEMKEKLLRFSKVHRDWATQAPSLITTHGAAVRRLDAGTMTVTKMAEDLDNLRASMALSAESFASSGNVIEGLAEIHTSLADEQRLIPSVSNFEDINIMEGRVMNLETALRYPEGSFLQKLERRIYSRGVEELDDDDDVDGGDSELPELPDDSWSVESGGWDGVWDRSSIGGNALNAELDSRKFGGRVTDGDVDGDEFDLPELLLWSLVAASA